MPPKRNPLQLNKLQLKTLALLQAIAEIDGMAARQDGGSIKILSLPHFHGDHLHLGSYTVMREDASGLRNDAVWVALARKGLVDVSQPDSALLTPAGIAYDTGIRNDILHSADHAGH